MKLIFVTMTILALSSCASVSGLREKKPLVQYNSPKSVDETVECITKKWNEHGTPFTTSKIKDGWSLNLLNTEFQSSYAVADIVKNENGSEVKYYEQAMFGRSWPEAGVKSCQ